MHSIPQRDTFFSVDVEKVDDWYASLKSFVNLLYEEAFYFKTEPGSYSLLLMELFSDLKSNIEIN